MSSSSVNSWSAAGNTVSACNSWGFVSGKVSAQEAELLPRSFFEGILRCRDLNEARQALGKTVYRSLFASDETIRDFSEVLNTYADSHAAEIFSLSPPHPLSLAWGLLTRYRTFRTLFNQLAGQNNPVLADLERTFAILTGDETLQKAMKEHLNCLARRESPQTANAVERSLFLDSAACTVLDLLKTYAKEPLIATYLHDRALLSAWSAILRARWNGVPADSLKRWFIFGDDTTFAAEVCASEHNPAAVVRSRLKSPSASSVIDQTDSSVLRNDVDAIVAEAMRDTIWSCRQVSFGPEKVLSHLCAVEVEVINLQLSLSAVALGIDRKVVTARLRREYA